MHICVYTYIPKYNLIGQYNVIIGMFLDLTICVFDLSVLPWRGLFLPHSAFISRVIVSCALWVFPHPLWRVCWCHPCPAHIYSVTPVRLHGCSS